MKYLPSTLERAVHEQATVQSLLPRVCKGTSANTGGMKCVFRAPPRALSMGGIISDGQFRSTGPSSIQPWRFECLHFQLQSWWAVVQAPHGGTV